MIISDWKKVLNDGLTHSKNRWDYHLECPDCGFQWNELEHEKYFHYCPCCGKFRFTDSLYYVTDVNNLSEIHTHGIKRKCVNGMRSSVSLSLYPDSHYQKGSNQVILRVYVENLKGSMSDKFPEKDEFLYWEDIPSGFACIYVPSMSFFEDRKAYRDYTALAVMPCMG